jgi:3-deoxy-manno-octulosonate cytidylyltransferase (CMP-KDO synthetase)
VAYVAGKIPSRFVINVQGDDPLVDPDVTDSMVEALDADSSISLALLAKRIDRREEAVRDSVVKMVFDQNHRALYFSRSPIPYERGRGAAYFKHIGPYAWRREALFEFAAWAQTPLERAESLEMLRMLEHGRSIKCIEVDRDNIEIDTPEDILAFEEYWRARGKT